MPSRHISIRLDGGTFDRLDEQSRRTGRSRSEIAKTLLEEGLRMEAHPGIVFRSGPAGRRPGLAGGPDVWEIARVLRDQRGEDSLRETAALTGLSDQQVRTAARYYAEHQDEIDAWIRRVDEEADHLETAWRREQSLLGG
jgi:hypothetical protein